MDFRFVKRQRAIAVVSCKSSAEVDPMHVQKLKPYVKHVFLFVECCAPKKVRALKDRARKAGYAGFGYLYTFDEKTSDSEDDQPGWLEFLDKVASIVKRAVRTR